MKRLGEREIAAALATLPGWRGDVKALLADYRFADFRTAFAFMNAVAVDAEALQHHPDWSNSYGRVSVALRTHDAGGVTANDVELACRVAAHADAHGGRLERGPAT